MHNHATYRLARAVRAAGGASLRFNFRGVGASEGGYDGGRGEAEDAAAALALLAARYPGLPRLACGFSFGAFAAAAAGPRDPGVAGLLLAGLAVRPAADLPRDLGPLRATPLPVAGAPGRGDQFGTPAEVERGAGRLGRPAARHAIAGATHLFTEALDAFEAEARGAAELAAARRAARERPRRGHGRRAAGPRSGDGSGVRAGHVVRPGHPAHQRQEVVQAEGLLQEAVGREVAAARHRRHHHHRDGGDDRDRGAARGGSPSRSCRAS